MFGRRQGNPPKLKAVELDDGLYVRFDDLLETFRWNGWDELADKMAAKMYEAERRVDV